MILDFLRGNEQTILNGIRNRDWDRFDISCLLDEVSFYQIGPLVDAVLDRLRKMDGSTDPPSVSVSESIPEEVDYAIQEDFETMMMTIGTALFG